MKNLVNLVSRKLNQRIRADKGATAVEYALIVGLIAVVIILAVAFLGDTISGIFEDVGSEISSRT
ncbi:MAG: Flp family type IVb pilin [Candidatus Nanopelagicaceae bacterium]